ncbi:hypothetical protein P4S73_20925 [Paraglaciecola sp. Hal342]
MTQLNYDFLSSKKAPKLPNLSFSVLGLGDKKHLLCQTAKDFDKKLGRARGKARIVDRADCDVDYDNAAERLGLKVLDKVQDELKAKAIRM